MKERILKVAPDYLALSFFDFLKHFMYIGTIQRNKFWMQHEDFTQILGYSCRTLFEICMMHYNKKDLVVVTTPLHHTSFRDTIEKYVKPDNIHTFEMNDSQSQIIGIPDVGRCDLVVITHLFGQDMDLSVLSDFKQKHDCVIIEDRVQGGTLDKKFSDEIADVAIYSMGMDKRPIAQGGGFIYIDDRLEDFISDVKEVVLNLPIERRGRRFLDSVKKIPTYLMYNSRFFSLLTIYFIRLMHFFNKKITVLSVTRSYRKKNPGFNRAKYMRKPSKPLLKSMTKYLNKHEKMEKRYLKMYKLFVDSLSPELISYYFPWFREPGCLTPYNTAIVEEQYVQEFLEFFSEDNISCIENPTYKTFNHVDDKDSKDVKFNNSIVYLPSIANMKEVEIDYLAFKLKQFYDLHHK